MLFQTKICRSVGYKYSKGNMHACHSSTVYALKPLVTFAAQSILNLKTRCRLMHLTGQGLRKGVGGDELVDIDESSIS